jgi:hypothetical protein
MGKPDGLTNLAERREQPPWAEALVDLVAAAQRVEDLAQRSAFDALHRKVEHARGGAPEIVDRHDR